jgi:hypothetical protein
VFRKLKGERQPLIHIGQGATIVPFSTDETLSRHWASVGDDHFVSINATTSRSPSPSSISGSQRRSGGSNLA